MSILNDDFNKRFDFLANHFLGVHKDKGMSKNEIVMYATLKLAEEYGELSEAVLMELGHQRQVKLDKYKKEDLEGEIADVLLQVLFLAHFLDIDVERVISEKLKKIEERTFKID